MDFFAPLNVGYKCNIVPPPPPVLPMINAIELTIFDRLGTPHRREYRKPDLLTPSSHPLAIRGSSIVFGRMSSTNQNAIGEELGGYIDALGKVDFACPVMSRCHARIDFEDRPAADGSNVFVVDAASHHGTFVKRDGILYSADKKMSLKNEDMIIFGKSVHKGGLTHDPLVAHVKLLVRSPPNSLFSPTFPDQSAFASSASATRRYGLSDFDIEVSDSDEASSDHSQDEDEEEHHDEDPLPEEQGRKEDVYGNRPYRFINIMDESDEEEDDIEIVQSNSQRSNQFPIRLPDFNTLSRDVEPIDVDQFPVLPVMTSAPRVEPEVIDVDAFGSPPLMAVNLLDHQSPLQLTDDHVDCGFGQNGESEASAVIPVESPVIHVCDYPGDGNQQLPEIHPSQESSGQNVEQIEYQNVQNSTPTVASTSAVEKADEAKELADLVACLQESVKKLRSYRLKSRRRIMLNKVEVDNRLDDVQAYMDELQQDVERINELIQDKGLSEVIETKNQIIEDMEEKEEEVRCEAEDIMHSYEDMGNEVEGARDEIEHVLEDVSKMKATAIEAMNAEIEACKNMRREAEESINQAVTSTKRKLQEFETSELTKVQTSEPPVKRSRTGFVTGLLVGGTAVCVGLSYL